MVVKYNQGWTFWEYTEVIAKRMKILYKYTPDIITKVNSLRIILKTSVAAERYNAIDEFNSILLSIDNKEEGTAISMMLSEEKEDYFKLVKMKSVPVEDLHYSLRRIRRSVEGLDSR